MQGAIVCSACHEPIKAQEVSFAPRASRHPGPASARPQEHGKNRHVPLVLLERMGSGPIARTMAAIDDPWSFLILRECFYGVRRFDDFRRHRAEYLERTPETATGRGHSGDPADSRTPPSGGVLAR